MATLRDQLLPAALVGFATFLIWQLIVFLLPDFWPTSGAKKKVPERLRRVGARFGTAWFGHGEDYGLDERPRFGIFAWKNFYLGSRHMEKWRRKDAFKAFLERAITLYLKSLLRLEKGNHKDWKGLEHPVEIGGKFISPSKLVKDVQAVLEDEGIITKEHLLQLSQSTENLRDLLKLAAPGTPEALNAASEAEIQPLHNVSAAATDPPRQGLQVHTGQSPRWPKVEVNLSPGTRSEIQPTAEVQTPVKAAPEVSAPRTPGEQSKAASTSSSNPSPGPSSCLATDSADGSSNGSVNTPSAGDAKELVQIGALARAIIIEASRPLPRTHDPKILLRGVSTLITLNVFLASAVFIGLSLTAPDDVSASIQTAYCDLTQQLVYLTNSVTGNITASSLKYPPVLPSKATRTGHQLLSTVSDDSTRMLRTCAQLNRTFPETSPWPHCRSDDFKKPVLITQQIVAFILFLGSTGVSFGLLLSVQPDAELNEPWERCVTWVPYICFSGVSTLLGLCFLLASLITMAEVQYGPWYNWINCQIPMLSWMPVWFIWFEVFCAFVGIAGLFNGWKIV